jgi:hypothetical protein
MNKNMISYMNGLRIFSHEFWRILRENDPKGTIYQGKRPSICQIHFRIANFSEKK